MARIPIVYRDQGLGPGPCMLSNPCFIYMSWTYFDQNTNIRIWSFDVFEEFYENDQLLAVS